MKKDISLLKHMLEDITDMEMFIEDMDFDSFSINILVRKGVCMSLINIGELTKSLSREFTSSHPQIPWKNIAGLRDVTAHKYHTLNLEIIWQVIISDIPSLKTFIKSII